MQLDLARRTPRSPRPTKRRREAAAGNTRTAKQAGVTAEAAASAAVFVFTIVFTAVSTVAAAEAAAPAAAAAAAAAASVHFRFSF